MAAPCRRAHGIDCAALHAGNDAIGPDVRSAQRALRVCGRQSAGHRLHGMQTGLADVIFANGLELPQRGPTMMAARGFQTAAATHAGGRTAAGAAGPDGTPAKAEAMT